MVAYSFKKEFIEAVQSGSKPHTIRSDRKRHAHPGEELQLYTGMRTKQCRKIGEVVCLYVFPAYLNSETKKILIDGLDLSAQAQEISAADGFKLTEDFWEFFSLGQARYLIGWAIADWMPLELIERINRQKG